MRANSRTLVDGLMGGVLAIGSGQVRAIEGTAAITGAVRVVDGDTLDLTAGTTTTRVRLFGIDAPEGGQSCRDGRGRSWPCGASARRAGRAHARSHRDL